MRHLLNMAIIFLIAGACLAQNKLYDEMGSPREIKGLTKLYVDANDTVLTAAMTGAIEKELPTVQIVKNVEDAELILLFDAFPIGKDDTGASGYAVKFVGNNRVRLLWKTTDSSKWEYGAERCAKSVVGRFIRAYRKAQ